MVKGTSPLLRSGKRFMIGAATRQPPDYSRKGGERSGILRLAPPAYAKPAPHRARQLRFIFGTLVALPARRQYSPLIGRERKGRGMSWKKSRRRRRAATKLRRVICLVFMTAWLTVTPTPAQAQTPMSSPVNSRGGAKGLELPEGVAERARRYEPLIAQAAARWGVDARLLWVIAYLESRFNPLAVSPKGARGMMQFMPATAARFGLKDPHDPAAAADAAARYVRLLLSRYGSRLDCVLAAYNAGEGAVDAWGGVPRYRETLAYVQRGMRMLGLPFAHPALLSGRRAAPASALTSSGPLNQPADQQPVRKSIYVTRRPPQPEDSGLRQNTSSIEPDETSRAGKNAFSEGEEKAQTQPAGVQAPNLVSRLRRRSIYYGGNRGRD
jgi:hypothetical protein